MIPMYGTAALVERNKEEILERFKFILNSSNAKNTSKVVLTVILGASILLFLSSYLFVPLPSYESPVKEIETEPGAHAITKENSYIVEDAKGSFYWIIFDGTKQQIVPFAVGDVFVKKYRTYQGKCQYRWWNQTKNCWVAGSTWKNV